MRRATLTLGVALLASCGAQGTDDSATASDPGEKIGTEVQGARSTDYPGPCQSEVTVPGTPIYLSADYHGLNPATGFIFMPDFGRLRLGISCVATGFVVIRIGPDSALCTYLGLCTEQQLFGMRDYHIDWVRTNVPGDVPFYHRCGKHGFGWYDATYVRPGAYLAIAASGSGFWGLVDGHGTMDTYAFFGNGGAWQPVNCPRPVVCGDAMCSWQESCWSCPADCGECPVCGDGICSRESCDSCPEDCGECLPECYGTYARETAAREGGAELARPACGW